MRAIRVLAPLLLAATLVAPVQAEPVSWTGPLSTRGRYIVDANGDRFKLKSGNWHGASGTWNGSGDINDPANHHSGEKADQVPLALDRAHVDEIIDSFEELGVNSVRLPFSNQMIKETQPVTGLKDFSGKTPLQVYDAVVERLTQRKIAVILNNHTNTSRWCCGVDGNERWNTSQSTDQWINDWAFMANRYKNNKRVVGADLYNEVRRTVWDDPNWGWGNQHDWQRASQQAADRIMETSPDLLVMVEGINWTGIPVDGLPHGRPTLEPVRNLSHTLLSTNKLVYAAHFYGYTGPNHTGATGSGETSDPRYQDLTAQQLTETVRRQALYVLQETQKHFTAPVWISEFGVGGRDETNPKARAWFENFVNYLIETDADFAYWPLVGFHTNRGGNGWALMHWDAAGNRMGLFDGDDWRAAAWRRLVASGRTGQIPEVRRWNMLTLDHADQVQSRKVRAQPDWNSGARKGVCPDGEVLAGLSHTGNRGLCTSGPQWTETTVVKDERYVQQDWASTFTKVQCPPGTAAIGYSARGSAFDGLLCAKAPTGTATRTVWFDRSDSRPQDVGDWASGHYKGQCDQSEHVAGVAYTGRDGRKPAALLCRKSA
ncbi:glycoside hydrolase family 5 protein [Lentzea tibetensis]|uniref:Glycoside hydrolase family 5 protein n=1 Tax=Lentzea tibetensis TaxID=2591470 RepID=A0A563ELU2_9PSEU|nr:cellulase family glycosylhydrolase [Lentzea tibetensis]TWP48086.1 glycoside hydrolase family 5 protein [Lentzea tibetensis]